MRRAFFLVTLLITNVAFAGSKVTTVDMKSLFNEPQKYDGKVVEVTGFVTIEFEGNALYLDQKSQAGTSYDKGIWLEISKTSFENKKFNGANVLVKGTFNLGNKGHMNLWKGALEKVSKLEIYKK